MKVTVNPDLEMSKEEVELADEAGEIKEVTDEQFKGALLKAKSIELSPQVVEFAAREMKMTPDEFVAYLLKQAGAAQ